MFWDHGISNYRFINKTHNLSHIITCRNDEVSDSVSVAKKKYIDFFSKTYTTKFVMFDKNTVDAQNFADHTRHTQQTLSFVHDVRNRVQAAM